MHTAQFFYSVAQSFCSHRAILSYSQVNAAMEHEQKLREKKKKNAEDDLEYMVKTSPDVACAFETRFVGNAILLEQMRAVSAQFFHSHRAILLFTPRKSPFTGGRSTICRSSDCR